MNTTAERMVTAQCLSVLHVEDERDMFVLTEDLLESVGIMPTWAENLGAARTELANNRFDLVLLDYALPDGNGLCFVEEIKSLYPKLPVIVVTCRADEALALATIEKGAVNFVLKDDIFFDLVPVIETVLGRKESWAYRRAVTDRITPWMEPYHPPEPVIPKSRFLGRAMSSKRSESAMRANFDWGNP